MHQDPKAYIAMLENPQRDAEQKPDEVIAALDLKPGETLADIGAGSGYFSFRLARKVGDTGRVYAVDINSDMILFMNRNIRDKKIKNVTTILSAPDDPLPRGCIDQSLFYLQYLAPCPEPPPLHGPDEENAETRRPGNHSRL